MSFPPSRSRSLALSYSASPVSALFLFVSPSPSPSPCLLLDQSSRFSIALSTYQTRPGPPAPGRKRHAVPSESEFRHPGCQTHEIICLPGHAAPPTNHSRAPEFNAFRDFSAYSRHRSARVRTISHPSAVHRRRHRAVHARPGSCLGVMRPSSFQSAPPSRIEPPSAPGARLRVAAGDQAHDVHLPFRFDR